MDFNDFVEKLQQDLGANFGRTPVVQKITKENGISYSGLSIFSSKCSMQAATVECCPVLNLERLFKQLKDKSYAEILVECCKLCNTPADESYTAKDVTNYNAIKDKIYFTLISTELNKEILDNCISVPFLDFSIIFKVMVNQGSEGIASIRVSKELFNIWDTSIEDIYSLALVNTPRLFPAKFLNLSDLINESGLECDFGDDKYLNCFFKVLTNECGINGASVILYPGLLNKIYEENGKFCLIPSSIHEFLVLNHQDPFSAGELQNLIAYVNESCVELEDKLGTRALVYDGEQLKVLE